MTLSTLLSTTAAPTSPAIAMSAMALVTPAETGAPPDFTMALAALALAPTPATVRPVVAAGGKAVPGATPALVETKSLPDGTPVATLEGEGSDPDTTPDATGPDATTDDDATQDPALAWLMPPVPAPLPGAVATPAQAVSDARLAAPANTPAPAEATTHAPSLQPVSAAADAAVPARQGSEGIPLAQPAGLELAKGATVAPTDRTQEKAAAAQADLVPMTHDCQDAVIAPVPARVIRGAPPALIVDLPLPAPAALVRAEIRKTTSTAASDTSPVALLSPHAVPALAAPVESAITRPATTTPLPGVESGGPIITIQPTAPSAGQPAEGGPSFAIDASAAAAPPGSPPREPTVAASPASPTPGQPAATAGRAPDIAAPAPVAPPLAAVPLARASEPTAAAIAPAVTPRVPLPFLTRVRPADLSRAPESAASTFFAAALQSSAPTPLAAPADEAAVQVPIDLKQELGIHRMIDRIEQLRDAADARDTRIRLVPDALGPVEVSVKRDGDGVRVHFTAEQPHARQLIADAQPRLTELAEARGVRIAQATVDSGTGDHGQSRQPAPQQSATPAAPPRARDTTTTDDAADARLA